ncbi:hypothetical protein [Deinococcus radiophilus]|uniref:hypothetical protein n=1 Tax=Deinococcus radiophilus TaxID=32062 RepID=UPI00361F2243
MSRLPSGYTVRPGTPADLPGVAGLLSAAHPERPVSLETLQRWDAGRSSEEPFQRLLIECGGRLVAFSETGVPREEDHPGWLSVEVVTLQPPWLLICWTWPESTPAPRVPIP